MKSSRPDPNCVEVLQSFFATPGFPYYGLWAKSGLQRHFVNNEKIIYLQKKLDLVECNISQNIHIM